MLLKPSQAAQLLNVSVRTLTRHADEGRWRFVRVGRARRYPVDQFREFFDVEEFKQYIQSYTRDVLHISEHPDEVDTARVDQDDEALIEDMLQ